ncbi:hypothetical protein [Lentilactobacillus hilgardii]|uniref:hypothetical protein n=2 Tax=Lentilactobacillus hilgardii TaxID=1588 RepID=UPI00390CA59F
MNTSRHFQKLESCLRSTKQTLMFSLKRTKGGKGMKKHEVIHFYKSGGYNHLVDVSVDDNLFAAVTFTKDEMEKIVKKYPLAKDSLFALVDGVEIKLKDLTHSKES